MPTILITGATGQVGSFLCEALLAEGHTVLGLPGRSARPLPPGVLPARGAWSLDGVHTLYRDNGPLDAVVHLAAQTSIPASWEDPAGTFHVNAELTVRLAYGLAKAQPAARLVFASSSNVFGQVRGERQDESLPLSPVSPYGISKAAAQLAVRNVREGLGVAATSLVLFMGASARSPESLVLRKITRQVAAVARGRSAKVRLGTMHVVRDICHARDFARAFKLFALSAQAVPGEYCCGSGQGRSIREMAEIACRLVGLDPSSVLEEDPGYARPNDIPSLVADTRRLRSLGWRPEVSFEALVRECLEHDLAATA